VAKPVTLIAGPTASGKSALALDLAERDGGWIVNADSMQVYADLDVLTARPSPADLARAPHRLYGHVDAAEPWSVARWLEDIAKVLDEAGVADVTTRLRSGDLVETLAEMEAEADLVIVGKRGEAADFARLHLGSNLERIVRGARKPVFVAARGFRPIKRLLIAYDGGTSALKAVDHIARSSILAGLDCHLLTVGQETPELRRSLEGAAAMLKGGGYRVTADIRPGQPETVISEAVEKDGIDLLVMGAYGHSRIRSLIIGSTTTEMVRSCKVPVLLFR